MYAVAQTQRLFRLRQSDTVSVFPTLPQAKKRVEHTAV